MKAWGIVVAAGSGARLGAGVPKSFRTLAGVPMVAHSIRAFDAVPSVRGITVVVPDGFDSSDLASWAPARAQMRVVAGGTSRAESVRAGLRTVNGDEAEAVVVHDAARPFVTPDLIERALAALAGADGAICAVPVTDTLKRADGNRVTETVARAGVVRAQTPQGFRLEALRRAHEQAESGSSRDGGGAHGGDGAHGAATDDAVLVERSGGLVVVVAGDERNIKVTTPADFELAERLFGVEGARGRSGTGYDAHAFADGRKLVIGGVEIPFDRGLAGHSDADVLSHAICDALLGAAALGDLGAHFPPSDSKWAGVASTELLRRVAEMVRDAGFDVASIDATVILERPAIAPHRDAMRAGIAAALGVDAGIVSVKATTTDGIGSIGRGEGAAATAIAQIVERGR
jgi:2-C-methyl-D-erythritol 4-phosphate cytidylyltransferase/2-C-methyl-D-erythritol 2,4-cyclodiphosphate synthase